jgi:hypothetical protein
MSSVEQFATCIKHLENVPTPFREALSKRIRANEATIHLLFSPAFRAGRLSTVASLLWIAG